MGLLISLDEKSGSNEVRKSAGLLVNRLRATTNSKIPLEFEGDLHKKGPKSEGRGKGNISLHVTHYSSGSKRLDALKLLVSSIICGYA